MITLQRTSLALFKWLMITNLANGGVMSTADPCIFVFKHAALSVLGIFECGMNDYLLSDEAISIVRLKRIARKD